MAGVMDAVGAVLATSRQSSKHETCAAPSESSHVPASTLWHRKHGRPSKRDAAAQKQYLTPSEEKALTDSILCWAERGYPVPVKLVRYFAWVIAHKRSSTFQILSNDDTIQAPGKNWPQGFYKRHPQLRPRKLRPIDWVRHDIYEKVVDWFPMIGKELHDPAKSANDRDLEELARILEFMPLAIVQAAAYIQQKGVRYSVRRYIEAFQKNEKQQTSLLNYEAGHLRRDPEAKNSIIITWQISFDEIREKWPSSADLLSLMSYFDRQGIPEDVLKVQLREEEIRDSTKQNDDGVRDDENDEKEDNEDDGASEISSDSMFEAAVERLRSYSFVSTGADGRTFEMHGLVQLATRKWLKVHGEDEKWKAQFCMKLNVVFPTGDHENWSLCETLFPHAKSAERQRPMENTSVREWAQILRKAGWYAWARGDYGEAERMCEKSAGALRKALGREDVETSYSLGMLASTYRNQGRWTEAEKMEVQVMETTKRVLGEEHPSTLTSMANLASTYSNQGRWTEAEQMEVQVMETTKRVLGEEHPSTLTSMANLASTYWNQGRWTEAEQMDVQVMETRKRVLGEEHPDTLTSMANLASTYRNQGRWTEAEQMEVQVMETTKRVLGEEHPDTLSSINNLASTYSNQGRWTEAEQMEVQVMETTKRVLGEEHPDTLTSMNNLAFTMKELGRKMEATKLMAECVQLRNRILGTEHHHALSSAAALAEWQNVE
jgi:tetratricopeptide (TPR) repeat protein